MQADQPVLPIAGCRIVARGRGLMQGHHGLRCDIGGYRYHPDPALGVIAEVAGVIARDQVELTADIGPHPADPTQIAGRVLDADNVRMGRQPGNGLVRHVHARPPGHIVQQHGQLDGFGDGLEMQGQSRLGGPIVIGGDDQRPVGPDSLGVTHQFDRLFGRRRAGPGDDPRPSGRHLHAQLHHPLVLIQRQRGALARRAHRYDAVDACGDLAFQKLREGGFVHLSVTKWCDQGGDHTLEQGGGH